MAHNEHTKSPVRVAAGLRATMKNPRVSEEAKARANDRLQELGGSKEHSDSASHDTESNRVLGGHKAVLHSEPTSQSFASVADMHSDQHTSDKAKEHSREILSAAGYHEFEMDEKLHNTRVLAGYKSALHSMFLSTGQMHAFIYAKTDPNVSEEAKQHAREYLKEHEVS
ncbi:hypothetical protein DXG01_008573 [Tephrocybe rancida]|nr:hypothetical protein DXG01_008573 [Tephrocybe rancida]